jgi:SET and MYND domain-containing protein
MTNSFTLTTADLAPVGVATSPICALFNHGCDPSAVIVFPKVGTGMNVVAIANIKAGDEVSYADST